MRISLLNVTAFAVSAIALVSPLQPSFAVSDAERIAALEKRLLELEQRLVDSEKNTKEVEQRLAETEQETKEVKVLASSAAATGGNQSSILGNTATFDILAGSAWRNLRWTDEGQWEGIKRGISEAKVIELLGYPPRSLDSLKPRVDKVYWYETSLRDWNSQVRGKVSFKDGKVVSFKKPDFEMMKSGSGQVKTTTTRRLP